MDSDNPTTSLKRVALSPLRSPSPSAASPPPSSQSSSSVPPPLPTPSSSPAPSSAPSSPSPSSPSSPHDASRAITPTPSRSVKHWPWRPNVYARLKIEGQILPVRLAEVTSTPPPDLPTYLAYLGGADGYQSPFWACVYIDELDYCWWAFTVLIILFDEILRLPVHEDVLAPHTIEIKSLVDDFRALRDAIASAENYGGSRLWLPLASADTLDEAISIPHICWPADDTSRLILHYSRNPGFFDNGVYELILHACNLCYGLTESSGLYFGDLPQEPLSRLGAWVSSGMPSFKTELEDLPFFGGILQLVMADQGLNLYRSPTLDRTLSSVPAPDIVGKGSYGQVFKVSHPYWGDLAVKEPLPGRVKEQNKRFESLSNFGIHGHPNILPVVASIRHKSMDAVAMQWAENGSLDNYLVKNPDSSRALLLLSIATALQQLHEDRWIHGDLHMASGRFGNIVISEDGVAFLCDFGLSKRAGDDGPRDDVGNGTVEGGVPIYMAPELYEPGARHTFASEVFAFGMVIFHAYSGTRPFVLMANHEVAQHDAAIIKAIVNGTRPTRDQVTRDDFSDEMWNLVQDCWKQDPAHRPRMRQVVQRMVPMLRLLPLDDMTRVLMQLKPIEITLFQPGDVALDDAMQSHERSAELRWSLSRMEHFGLKRFFTHHLDVRDKILVERAHRMLYGPLPLMKREECDPEVLIRLYEIVTGDSFAQLAPLLPHGSPYDILNYKRLLPTS